MNGAGTLNAGTLALSASTTMIVPLSGTVAGTGYPQLVVSGAINLSNAMLSLTSTVTGLTSGQTFDLIKNTSGQPIGGTFLNLPQGAAVTVGSQVFQISYTGGASGNDVVLTYIPPLYTDPDWSGYTNGTTITNANPGGTSEPGVIGQNAFATVDAAIAAAVMGEQIYVNSGSKGTYSEDVLINKPVGLIIQQNAVSFNSLADTVSTAAITLNTNLTVGSDGNSTTLSSPIGGTGSFTKTGSGTMILAGDETLTGAAIVNAGVLDLCAVAGLSDAVTVNSGGILRMGVADGRRIPQPL